VADIFDTALIEIQSSVRDFFGWAYSDDLDSALSVSKYFEQIAPFGVEKWGFENRRRALNSLQQRLTSANNVFIIGASISNNELTSRNLSDGEIIAADGSVGAIGNHHKLACVVTDFDGHPYLDDIAELGVCFVTHAHGDNQQRWLKSFETWKDFANPPELILSHQVNETIFGMDNYGGFTDGDRAVCLALALGVPVEKITLLGFSTKKIGEWSGQTNKEKKLQKLNWMFKILQTVGLSEQIEN